jgi:hypothetical protein
MGAHDYGDHTVFTSADDNHPMPASEIFLLGRLLSKAREDEDFKDEHEPIDRLIGFCILTLREYGFDVDRDELKEHHE